MATPSTAYIWPSPQLDTLESLRWDLDRHPIAPFAALHLLPFLRRRSLGEAYHDMATHNNADGTGGMDVSIRFPEEQARAENAADRFNNILRLLAGVASRCVSSTYPFRILVDEFHTLTADLSMGE
ncbi:hypothetical protein B0H13DRAFT_2355770 [Mycena leptocephala]|nr:hypothetical protein B0H13DRAFT_2355770 [Mycena leptocephala]